MDESKKRNIIRIAAIVILLILITAGELILGNLRKQLGVEDTSSANDDNTSAVEVVDSSSGKNDTADVSDDITFTGHDESGIDTQQADISQDSNNYNDNNASFDSYSDDSKLSDAQSDETDNFNNHDSSSDYEITYTFRKQSLYEQHFEKHGAEMGYDNKEDYLAGANRVINDPNSLHKTEAEDGDDIYYLESTNEIVFVSQDGYIRTYFSPSRGIDYYNKQ